MEQSQIYEKAVQIISDKKKQDDYEKMCFAARICPTCGSSLLVEHKNEKSWGFWKPYTIIVYCSQSRSHYEDKTVYDLPD